MIENRSEWANYIRSHEFVWRFLYARGDITHQQGNEIAELNMKQLLERLQDRKDSSVFLARLHFLFQPRLLLFFKKSLEPLIRSISHTTHGHIEVTNGKIRGNVNWAITQSQRLTGAMSVNSYSTRYPKSSFNTPENQLLKLFLANVAFCINILVSELGTTSVTSNFISIQKTIDEILRSPWAREVKPAFKATPLMYKGAQRSRNPHYKVVAELEKQYEATILETKWEAILKLISRGWLEPIQEDDLFELYTLVRVLDIIKNDLHFGEPRKLWLIKFDRLETAEFYREHDTLAARIYFDLSPTEIFQLRSEYKDILNLYDGFRASSRRPDIIIEFKSSEYLVRLIIECKKSDDDDYARSSIYKALGYLKDFQALWPSNSKQTPKIIIAFPNIIQVRENVKEEHELALVGAGDDRLSELIIRSLKTANA